jgi:hypothetical protein
MEYRETITWALFISALEYNKTMFVQGVSFKLKWNEWSA